MTNWTHKMFNNKKEKSKSEAHCQETRSCSHLSSTRHIRRNLPLSDIHVYIFARTICLYVCVHICTYVQYRLPYYPASRFECVKVSKEIMKLCKGDFDYKCTSEFIMKYAKFSIISIKRQHHKIVNTNNNSPSSTRELWDKNCIFCELHLFFYHLCFCSISQRRNCPF